MAEDPGATREAIVATRAQLADTMHVLSEHLDVKGRAQHKLAEATGELRDRSHGALDGAKHLPGIARGAASSVGRQAAPAARLVRGRPAIAAASAIAVLLAALLFVRLRRS